MHCEVRCLKPCHLPKRKKREEAEDEKDQAAYQLMVERHGDAVAQSAEEPKEGDMRKLSCNLKKNLEAEVHTSCTITSQHEHHAVCEGFVLVFGTSSPGNCN